MIQYNMLDAKNNLSKICKLLKEGKEDYILIAKKGKPIAKITSFENKRKDPSIYKNKLQCLKDIDWFNDDIEKLFYGED